MCSKIHLTAFWELSSLQTDCICATLTPFFLHRQHFSPSLVLIIWIGIGRVYPTPAVPGDSQQESKSTEILGSRTRAIPKTQEEGYTCDNPQTALSSGAMVGHTALLRSWESLQCLAGCDKWMERYGHKSQQGKFPPGYGEHFSGGISAPGDIQHLPGQDMISLFHLWSLLEAGAGGEAPSVSPCPISLTPEFLCQLLDGRRATALHTLHSGKTQARTSRLT